MLLLVWFGLVWFGLLGLLCLSVVCFNGKRAGTLYSMYCTAPKNKQGCAADWVSEPGCWRRWSVPGNQSAAIKQPSIHSSTHHPSLSHPSIRQSPHTSLPGKGKKKELNRFGSIKDLSDVTGRGKKPRHPNSKPQTQPDTAETETRSLLQTHMFMYLFRVQMEVDLEFCFSPPFPLLCFAFSNRISANPHPVREHLFQILPPHISYRLLSPNSTSRSA